SHMISSVLQEAGYKVGLYTSPHLKDFKERIRVNGMPISETDVIDFVDCNKSFLKEQGLSFFEMTVGMAFDYFAKQQVDIAVIEVGLGGRLDSTNIVSPLVSVITNIGYDHIQFLGDKLSEIAFEKAGIIKPGVPVVIGEKQNEIIPVFQDMATKNNTSLYFAEDLINGNYTTDLLGNYQLKNVKTAVQTLQLLRQKEFNITNKVTDIGLQNVVKNTDLKGRWQILNLEPKVICDTAHNEEGLKIVLDQLKNEKFQNLHIVLGVVNDKNLSNILPLFPKNATYYFCKPNIPRGLEAKELQQNAIQFQLKGEVYLSVIEAYQVALDKAKNDDLVFVGGSTFVVAELPL
ncbi:MAG: bifunctional folylpolyglutamate synthase/dihydrofolate synthase, partial [Flavobacteriaceae bacterium]|nr:bifunctional folylpolyglutamate synthase/dihydrofolate synthase [Flavobacteriaceae bacterium]